MSSIYNEEYVMFLLYFYTVLAIILSVYMIVERKRLLFYREINQMKHRVANVAEIPVSGSKNPQMSI